MPTISREEHARSTDFLNTLNRLMEFVEGVLPFINEQQYLLACNDLKSLNDIHDRSSVRVIYEYIAREVRSNPTYHQHEQRARMKIIDKRTQLTDAFKLAHGGKVCPKCDRIVMSISLHQFTDVCKRTHDTKRLSIKTQELDTAKLTEATHLLRAWAIKFGKKKFYIHE